MKLTVKDVNETLITAMITAEQAHYILNYLGKTYVDGTHKEENK